MPKLISRSIRIGEGGLRTSMKLDAEVWQALEEICIRERMSIPTLMARLEATRENGVTLTSEVRMFIFRYFREAVTEEGHTAANHGPLRRPVS